MASVRVLCMLSLTVIGTCVAQPTKPAFWKGTPMDGAVEEMRSACAENDALACMKYKVMDLFDTIFKKDSYKISEAVEISRNSFAANEVTSRSDSNILDTIDQYIQSHDVTFKLPVGGAKVTMSPRELGSEQLNLKVNFDEDVQEIEGKSTREARKSKLKKIIMPIMVFVLLKAITLIPLALGVLGLKAWNALQLSFFSFVVSIALAIFQLCKKIAVDNTHSQIQAHGGWDSAYAHYARSMGAVDPKADADELAYQAYSKN